MARDPSLRRSRLATSVFRLSYGLLAAPVLAALAVANARLAAGGDPLSAGAAERRDDLVPRLAFLEDELDQGAGERMQRLFPEGYVFMHALYGLAWANVAIAHGAAEPALRERGVAEARWAAERIDSDAGRASFDPSLDPPLGMFFTSWSSVVRAGVVLASSAGGVRLDDAAALAHACEAIEAALASRATPFPPSYPDRAWPADAFPGMVVLRACDERLEARHGATRAWWLRAVRARLDPETGLVPHSCSAASGAPGVQPRGGSSALMLRFWPELDAPLAAEQYALFRAAFVDTRLGLPAVLEYRRGVAGRGDVDSGPLLLGVSLPGSAVAIGAALRAGDSPLARALGVESEAFGLSLDVAGKKRQLLGLMPIGDAFVTWSWSATPWFGEAVALPDDVAGKPGGARWPLVVASLALAAALAWPLTLEVQVRARAGASHR
ncbi:MAG: hypothetical protein IPK07_13790 [Deltaproteobacteria bacterium]|nr:hypothetical protein [Deltaproteobacteria bacterium]